MKMTYVAQPNQFVAGLGQYTRSEMLHGLSWLAATDTDLMSSVSGLGQLTVSGNSVMDAIIRNAAEMNIKTRIITEARAKMAKINPGFAMKLSAAMKKAAIPGTNVSASG